MNYKNISINELKEGDLLKVCADKVQVACVPATKVTKTQVTVVIREEVVQEENPKNTILTPVTVRFNLQSGKEIGGDRSITLSDVLRVL